MDPQAALPYREQVEQFRRRFRTGLVTLVFTDLAGSTQLKQTLGDREGVALIQHHHSVVRELLRQFAEAEEISTAGDSFFLVFARPSDAVRFALLLHARNRALSAMRGSSRREEAHPEKSEIPGSPAGRRNPKSETELSLLTSAATALQDRIGIHVGEVVIEHEQAPGKARDFYGSQVDIAARVMGLAKPGQVLLTRFAFDSARAMLKGTEIDGLNELAGSTQLQWLNHGPYLLKGIDEPVEICEVRVGAEGPAPPPTTSEKAQRHVSPDAEPVLGWRPALDQRVPGTRWILEGKLGEGGFGEVWAARHETLREKRVFKFCFRADRVRSLKREVTLFKVLKERVGEHPNIVKLYDVYFDQPPYYVEMEYVAGKDLANWCREQGGVEKVPLETRLEIVAQVAEALQAAHDAGIIHRDIKPGNILIQRSSRRESAPTSSGGKDEPTHVGCYEVHAKLTDFGIGQVVSEEVLAGVTKTGFTETIVADTSSSKSGTLLYLTPEVLSGKPASTRSDIYSLGVVLYQLLVGDFARPVTTDWAYDISDPLLRDDLQHCFAGNPQDRFAGAGQLAKNLRALPQRKAALLEQQAKLAAAAKAAYRRGLLRATAAAVVIVASVAALAVTAISQARRASARELGARRNLYAAQLNQAQQMWKDGHIRRALELLEQQRPGPGQEDFRGFEWRYLWRLCQDESLFTFTGHAEFVQAIAISTNGQIVATASGDGTAKLWDITSRRVVASLRGDGNIRRSIAISPDGKLVATGGAFVSQKVKLWDVVTQRELADLEGHSNTVENLAFSPDGKILVSASQPDGMIKVWDVANGKLLRSLPGPPNERPWVAFSPDGRTMASTSGDKTLKLWDVQAWEVIATLPGHENFAVCVAWSPDGKMLASCSTDSSLKLWDVDTRREIVPLRGHKAWVSSVTFSPDGRTLATTCVDGTIKLWDVVTRQEITTLKGHTAWVNKTVFLPDGKTLLSVSDDKTMKLWSTTPRSEVDLLRGHTSFIVDMAFSPEGKVLATASVDGTIRVWDIVTQRELVTLEGHRDQVSALAFSPDGQMIASGSHDKSVRLWDLDKPREATTFDGHTDRVTSVAFSRDGTMVISAGQDKTIRFWDRASRSQVEALRGHTDGILRLALSSDGKLLASAAADRTVRLWDMAARRETDVLPAHSNAVVRLHFSPDGRFLATVGQTETAAKLWDVTTKRRAAKVLTGHFGSVLFVAFSPDSKMLATTSQDSTARLWSVATGRELAEFRGHAGWVESAAFSPDGKTLGTSGHDGTIKLWSIPIGQQVAELPGHTTPFSKLMFSPDGSVLAASGGDRLVRLWRAVSLPEVEAAEKAKGRTK